MAAHELAQLKLGAIKGPTASPVMAECPAT